MSVSPPPPPPGYPPPAYGPPPVAQPAGTVNGFAVASLVLGILAPCGAGVLSVIFGWIALVQVKRRGQRGRGLAVGGLVATGVWVVILGVLGWFALTSGASRNDAGEIVSPGRVSTEALVPGDCVAELSEGGNITSVPGVPCADAHQGEVFAVFDLADGDWPGQDVVDEQAFNECVDRLESYSQPAFDDPQVDIFYLVPTERHWRSGDREVVCITYYLDGRRTGGLTQ